MTPAGQPSAGATSNQYQVLGHLATGGMAELYLARSVGIAGFERYVVLKRIMAEHGRNHRFVTMFLDEARLAAQLHHPNIAQVHDIGRVADSYFFTMEYVHGENVRDLLQRVAALKRQIPFEHTLAVIAGAAAGLHYAHEKRGIDRSPLHIVHRDVSPSNLMVAYEGAVKLVDFGIAKAATRMTETRSGAVKGKVAYMSPEQCTGGTLDRRSDIFSLGIILWEMLTMSRLFKYSNDFETMSAIVNGTLAPPSSRRPDIPRDLDAIATRALARRPEDRFQTAGELLHALEAHANRERLSLSTMSLGRYLRELFGERPEPWYELEAAGEHTSLMTIETTSADLAIPMEPDPFGPQSTVRSFAPGRARKAEWQPSGAHAPLAPALLREPTPLPLSLRPATITPPERRRPGESSGLPLPPPNDTGPQPIQNVAGLVVDPIAALDAVNEAVTLVAPVPMELSNPAMTRVERTSAPLIVPPPSPPVLRATPDGEPSWRGEHDPSWRGGTPGSDSLEAFDLRPRRRWMLWTALGAALAGVLVAILVTSRAAAPGAGDAVVPPDEEAPVAVPVVDPDEPVVPDAPAALDAPDAAAAAAAVVPAPAGPPEVTPLPPPSPPPARTKPRVVKPRPLTPRVTTPRAPRPTPPKPKKDPVPRCGDPMGLYPPCG